MPDWPIDTRLVAFCPGLAEAVIRPEPVRQGRPCEPAVMAAAHQCQVGLAAFADANLGQRQARRDVRVRRGPEPAVLGVAIDARRRHQEDVVTIDKHARAPPVVQQVLEVGFGLSRIGLGQGRSDPREQVVPGGQLQRAGRVRPRPECVGQARNGSVKRRPPGSRNPWWSAAISSSRSPASAARRATSRTRSSTSSRASAASASGSEPQPPTWDSFETRVSLPATTRVAAWPEAPPLCSPQKSPIPGCPRGSKGGPPTLFPPLWPAALAAPEKTYRHTLRPPPSRPPLAHNPSQPPLGAVGYTHGANMFLAGGPPRTSLSPVSSPPRARGLFHRRLPLIVSIPTPSPPPPLRFSPLSTAPPPIPGAPHARAWPPLRPPPGCTPPRLELPPANPKKNSPIPTPKALLHANHPYPTPGAAPPPPRPLFFSPPPLPPPPLPRAPPPPPPFLPPAGPPRSGGWPPPQHPRPSLPVHEPGTATLPPRCPSDTPRHCLPPLSPPTTPTFPPHPMVLQSAPTPAPPPPPPAEPALFSRHLDSTGQPQTRTTPSPPPPPPDPHPWSNTLHKIEIEPPLPGPDRRQRRRRGRARNGPGSPKPNPPPARPGPPPPSRVPRLWGFRPPVMGRARSRPSWNPCELEFNPRRSLRSTPPFCLGGPPRLPAPQGNLPPPARNFTQTS